MNMRIKLFVPILIAGAVFGATLHFYWLPHYKTDEARETLREQEILVQQLQENLIDPLLTSDLDAIHRTIAQHLKFHPYWSALDLTNGRGMRLYPIAPHTTPRKPSDVYIGREISYQGLVLGNLTVTIDTSGALELLSKRIRETQILFWILLLISAGAIYFILDRVIYKPIEVLTDALNAIGKGDYSTPLPDPHSTDFNGVYNALCLMKKNRFEAERSLSQSNIATAIALKQLENYKFALDKHQILVTLDTFGNIVYANNKFHELLGQHALLEPAYPYQKFIAAQHGDEFMSHVINTVMLGRVWQGDVLHVNAQKQPIWLNLSVVLFDSNADKNENFILLATDISAHKAVEIALREQQTLMQSVVTHLPIVLWAINAQGVFTLSVGRALRDLGLKSGEVAGQSAFEIYNNYPDVISQIRRTLSGEQFVAETQVAQRWYETHYAPMRDANNTIVGAIGVSTDITERRATDQQLRLAARVFADSSEGIIITNEKKEILHVNQAFTTMTAYTSEEALGQTPKLLSSGRHDKEFYAQLWEEVTRTGHWTGEIWNKRKNGELYPEWLAISAIRDDKNHITNYVGIFSDITVRKRAQQEIERMAHHDALTDLPNRNLLRDRFEQAAAHAAREGGKVALMFLDLDHFKHVNDTYGHQVGDELLKTVAQRLSHCVRQTDTLSRQGGDEFLIVMPRVDDAAKAATVAKKIVAQIGRPITIDRHTINISASIGIGVYPDDGDNFEDLVKSADAAMYHAKQSGRNRYQFFDEKMNARTHKRQSLEVKLRRALTQGELQLHYQPQIDLRTGITCGAEALLRWHDADLGDVAPDRIIPLAEETGLIHPLGEWIIQEACQQFSAWQTQGLGLSYIAVNLSTLQLHRDKLAGYIENVLTRLGLPTHRLELEIAEPALYKDLNIIRETLAKLRDMDMPLTLDEFGTGATHLDDCADLGIRKIKIDRRFIHDDTQPNRARALVSAFIAMAQPLQLKVVAVGIETPTEQGFLRVQGCDYGQGYYFSQPLQAKEFAQRGTELPRKAAGK
ncbi:MAG: EAL domain-containing protein [Pseudomonadota bacterium]